MSDVLPGEVDRHNRRKSGAAKRKERRTASLCEATGGLISPRSKVIVTISITNESGVVEHHRETFDSAKEAMARAEKASFNRYVDMTSVHIGGYRVARYIAGVRT